MKRVVNVPAEVKRRAVERVAAGEAAADVAADLKVHRNRLYDWQEQVRQGGLEALRGPGRPRTRPVPFLTCGWRALINDQPAARV